MRYIKKYKLVILFAILLISSLIISIIQTNNNDNKNILEYIEENEIDENIEEISNLIKIDVKGAVKNPGVYELEAGMRVIDAINKAGGLLYYANSQTINLSKSLKDEMVIIVYTNDEIAKIQQGTTVVKYVDKECTCPKIENNACIENKDNASNENGDGSNKVINLNTASLEELVNIPGIGEAKAKAIIKYREENNNFKDISEIKNISGIGDATYEKLKDYITV